MGCLSGALESDKKRAQSTVLNQLINYKKNLDQKFILEQKLDQFDENKKSAFFWFRNLDRLASASWGDSTVFAFLARRSRFFAFLLVF